MNIAQVIVRTLVRFPLIHTGNINTFIPQALAAKPFTCLRNHPSVTRSILHSSYPSLHLARLTPILICRFLLNLRQLGEPDNYTHDASNYSRFSIRGFRVPTFIDFVGNMGQDLMHSSPGEGGNENYNTIDVDVHMPAGEIVTPEEVAE